MAKRGRPRKSDEDRHDYRLVVRFTKEEKMDLEMAANNAGFWSMGAYIRYLVQEDIRSKEWEEDEYRDIQ